MSLKARFMEFVDYSGPVPPHRPDLGECWLWMGTRIKAGYGQMRVDGKHRSATHLALEFDGRPVPDGMLALHHCDNPPCVKPSHLFIGTYADNVADMYAKGRGLIGRQYGPEHAANTSRAVASTWAGYTPEERKARVAKFRPLVTCAICGEQFHKGTRSEHKFSEAHIRVLTSKRSVPAWLRNDPRRFKTEDHRRTCYCGHRYGDHATGGTQCLAVVNDSDHTSLRPCWCHEWTP